MLQLFYITDSSGRLLQQQPFQMVKPIVEQVNNYVVEFSAKNKDSYNWLYSDE